MCLLFLLVALTQEGDLENLAEEDPQILFRRALYDFSQGDYVATRARLEALLTPSSRLNKEEDELEARKTLGTLYFLRGEEKRAREQFELVLLLKNDMELDIYSTAPPVLRFFDLVRAETRVKANEVVHVFQMRRNAFEAPRVIERRLVRHSAALSYLPFGVGQFQNGQIGMGALFLVLEAVMLTANVAGYIAGQLLGDNGVIQRSQATARDALLAVQYGGLGAFLTTWVIGAIHARAHFQPIVTLDRDITPEKKKRTEVGVRFSLAF
jgi:tetratricopeptide (TPR) repeat protein